MVAGGGYDSVDITGDDSKLQYGMRDAAGPLFVCAFFHLSIDTVSGGYNNMIGVASGDSNELVGSKFFAYSNFF